MHVPSNHLLRPELLLALLAPLLPWPAPSQAAELDFATRVEAQHAIERVYYSHQIAATKPFEEAVPREVVERKVRTYLKQSVALERFWKTPVTAEMLRREAERMARGTRMPERLAELYAALGNDSLLILECLARPSLVDRLARNFHAFDARIHGQAREAADTLRRKLVGGEVHLAAEDTRRMVVEFVREAEVGDSDALAMPAEPDAATGSDPILETLQSDRFDRLTDRLPDGPGDIATVTEERDAFDVWIVLERGPDRIRAVNYSIAKRSWDEWWAAIQSELDEAEVSPVVRDQSTLTAVQPGRGVAALSPCPPNDTWSDVSPGALLTGRYWHSAVWTGSQMIVWGGRAPSRQWFNTGARYDPATDTWSPTATMNAPAVRSQHTAVWTGSEMIVWGGSGTTPLPPNSGGRYDPVADVWTPTSIINAPAGRYFHSAVWTGSRMIVWGGERNGYLNTGGVYDPISDTWAATSLTAAPSPRWYPSAIWTGSRMIVWGGYAAGALNTGGQYDPVTDTWTPTSTTNAPSGKSLETAVWTGSLMLAWGGSVGGRYDPTTDTWIPMSTANAPENRNDHSVLWTGSHMVVWGGFAWYGESVNTGGRYDLATDTWTPTSLTNAPSRRHYHTAIWTENHMIVWGGWDEIRALDSGGGYALFPDQDSDGFSECAGDCELANATIYPGAPQICDGLNNDCADPTWPAVPAGELDSDGDGYRLCAADLPADCADSDSGVWTTPGDVRDLVWPGPEQLAWSTPEPPGGTTFLYSQVRSPSAGSFVTGAVCLDQSGTPATGAEDSEIPPPDGIFYYLIRARNACGYGPWGYGSDGSQPPVRSCP